VHDSTEKYEAVYGLRVIKPHHDGTPHRHLLLFVKKQNTQSLIAVFRHYAMEESPDEEVQRNIVLMWSILIVTRVPRPRIWLSIFPNQLMAMVMMQTATERPDPLFFLTA